MGILIYTLLAVIVLLGIIAIIHLHAQLQVVNRLMDVNKQLTILVAGQEPKPETLRALVASQKPPQGKLKGIATKSNQKKKPANKDFVFEVGGTRGV